MFWEKDCQKQIALPSRAKALSFLVSQKCHTEIGNEWKKESYWFCWKSSALITLWSLGIAMLVIPATPVLIPVSIAVFISLLGIGKLENTCCYDTNYNYPQHDFNSPLFPCSYHQYQPSAYLCHRLLFKLTRLISYWRELSRLPHGELEGQIALLKSAITERAAKIEGNIQATIASYENEARLLEENEKKYLTPLPDDSDVRQTLELRTSKIINHDKEGEEEAKARKSKLNTSVAEFLARLDTLIPMVTANRAFVPLLDKTITDERWAQIEEEVADLITKANYLLAEVATPSADLDHHSGVQSSPSAPNKVVPITRVTRAIGVK